MIRSRLILPTIVIAAGAVLAGPLVTITPAEATGPDHCRLETVPGHNNDRISRRYLANRQPKHGEHLEYKMVGIFNFRTFCSTHNFVQGASASAAVLYAHPSARKGHPITDFHFLNCRHVTYSPKKQPRQLIIQSNCQWDLEPWGRAGASTYKVHVVSTLTGHEPAQYVYDNRDEHYSRTHSYRYLTGTRFYS